MLRICTWNIGCFSFLKYAKYFGVQHKGQKIIHEYFQPKINGTFVSNYIEEVNPDIVFLQEFYFPEDTKSIAVLKNYSHQKLVHAWYHKHCILIASKKEFKIEENKNFSIVSSGEFNFIPIHLNSFSALKRLDDARILNELANTIPNLIILGDTNIWSRGEKFVFSNDKKAYKMLTETLSDFSKKIKSTTYLGLGLDKVFGSKNIQAKNIESPRTRSNFMDHYPIVFDILDVSKNNSAFESALHLQVSPNRHKA